MEALHRIDTIKPNTYSQAEKIKWLSTLDGIIKTEIIDSHEGAESVIFNGYTEDADLTTVLLVPAPYDDIYIYWLESKIDYFNGEIGKYNNSITTFNEAHSSFTRYYNRTHMPLGKKFKYFGNHTTNTSQAPSEEIPLEISFTIANKTYYTTSGTTWREWVKTEDGVNSGWYINNLGYMCRGEDIVGVMVLDGRDILADEQILANAVYDIWG